MSVSSILGPGAQFGSSGPRAGQVTDGGRHPRGHGVRQADDPSRVRRVDRTDDLGILTGDLTSPSAGADSASVLASAGAILALNPEDLTRRLQGGESLNDIAAARSVPHETLVSVIQAGLSTDLQGSDGGLATAERIAGFSRVAASAPAAPVAAPADPATTTAPTQRFSLTTGGGGLDSLYAQVDGFQILNSVGSSLALNVDDLAARLQHAPDLTAVAAGRGVSHDTLIAAIKEALPDGLRGSSAGDALAAQIATSAQPQNVASGPAPSGAAWAQSIDTSLDATSSLFVMTPADLSSQLAQGASLDSISSSLGLSHQALIAAVQTDLPASTPGWTDVTELAERVAGATVSQPAPPADPPVAPSASTPDGGTPVDVSPRHSWATRHYLSHSA